MSRMACACFSVRPKRSIRPSWPRCAVRAARMRRDDLVDVIQRDEQALQDVGAGLGLVQVVAGAPGDDVLLMLDVMVDASRCRDSTLGSPSTSASMMTPKVSCSCVCL